MQTYQQLLDEGERLVGDGDHLAAIRVYAQAVELEPDRKEAFTKLGLFYRQYGDADSAMSFFAQAARLDASDAFVRFNLGLIQYQEGRLDAARGSVEEAVALVEKGVAGARVEAEALEPGQQSLVQHQCDELDQTVADAKMLLAEITSLQDRQTLPEARPGDAL